MKWRIKQQSRSSVAIALSALFAAGAVSAGLRLQPVPREGNAPTEPQGRTRQEPIDPLTNSRIEADRLLQQSRFAEADQLLEVIEAASSSPRDLAFAKSLRGTSARLRGEPADALACFRDAVSVMEAAGGFESEFPDFFASRIIDVAQLQLHDLNNPIAAAAEYNRVWAARELISRRRAHLAASQQAFSLARSGRYIDAELVALELQSFHGGDPALAMPPEDAILFHLSRAGWKQSSGDLSGKRELLRSLWDEPRFADLPQRASVGVELAELLTSPEDRPARTTILAECSRILSRADAGRLSSTRWDDGDSEGCRQKIAVLNSADH